jgi:hypothetical protein
MQQTQKGAVLVVLCCFATAEAHAHGVVGQRSFIEPFVTEDVNPKNEFVIARPEWDRSHDGRAFSLGFGLEKKLADRFSITLDSEWDSIGPAAADEPATTGFNNLGITLKYAFFISPEHEAIVSAALESAAPTGSLDVSAEQDWSFKPFLLYGKGFGDLPEPLDYLRPFAVQGDAGPEVSTDRANTMIFAYDITIEYSIPYLQAGVRDMGLRWPLSDLLPVVEFNFNNGLRGDEAGSFTAIVTPGIVYMDRYVELGVAGRFPLNGDANDLLGYGVIGIVDLFLDDIFPVTRWQPF